MRNYFNKIAIMGKAGAGKDLVADYLKIWHGYEKFTFAEDLYEICQDYYNMETKDRALLQDVGVKMREVDSNVFVNRLFNKMKDYESDKIVVSDVRFINEYNALRDAGFIFLRVEASLETRIKRIQERDHIEVDEEYINRIQNNPIETQCDSLPAIRVINEETLDFNSDEFKLFDYLDRLVYFEDMDKEVSEKEYLMRYEIELDKFDYFWKDFLLDKYGLEDEEIIINDYRLFDYLMDFTIRVSIFNTEDKDDLLVSYVLDAVRDEENFGKLTYAFYKELIKKNIHLSDKVTKAMVIDEDFRIKLLTNIIKSINKKVTKAYQEKKEKTEKPEMNFTEEMDLALDTDLNSIIFKSNNIPSADELMADLLKGVL
ncbi:AAA family ATPase [Peptoniphilus porci]|uniref:Dephospho-CoA kinase n=1 Tax=Peptoniphilus porci TaxID=2652280 RepID=A0A1U7LX29_9FIRM|nr:AAA family ATPase [Peptoniphilus porci]OLR61631.1 hypothetical protein BIV18_09770 [Peptoniphilus porci]